MAIKNNIAENASEFGIKFDDAYYRIVTAAISRQRGTDPKFSVMIDLSGYASSSPADDTKEVQFKRYHANLTDIESASGDEFLDKCYSWVMAQDDMDGSTAVQVQYMSLTINHQTNDISNSTGTVKLNGTAVGGDNSPIIFYGSRGVFGGGQLANYSNTNVIDYITIANTGNATDFGDLTASKLAVAACSNGTRGLFGGGNTGSRQNVIEYITIASTGNGTDFGDLTIAREQLASCSSNTRGLFGGGTDSGGSKSNVIDYVTIASTGNATDFGDLTVARDGLAACSSGLRGLFAGGNTSKDTIDYVTIDTAGNAADFGNLTVARHNPAACSNNTRGLFGGGDGSNVIDYVTIDTTGDATDFGDLTAGNSYGFAACSSGVRGVFAGGYTSGYTNVIDYVTIDTTGNAADFGDLTVGRLGEGSCSGT